MSKFVYLFCVTVGMCFGGLTASWVDLTQTIDRQPLIGYLLLIGLAIAASGAFAIRRYAHWLPAMLFACLMVVLTAAGVDIYRSWLPNAIGTWALTIPAAGFLTMLIYLGRKRPNPDLLPSS